MAQPKLYKALDIDKNATDDQIKKAYRKLILKYHPDKNPKGMDRYREIQKAYDVLSVPDKRKLYDAYGERGIQPGRMPTHKPQFKSAERPKERSKDVVHPLKVSLDEMYDGIEKKLSLNRRRLCVKCNGAGGFGQQQMCRVCSGIGVTYRQMQASHMVMPVPCAHCQATGKQYQQQCDSCHGRRYWQEKKIMTVTVDKGMTEGKVITLRGEADQEFNKETGDIVIELVAKDHDRFTRHGNDVFTTMNVSLREACLGLTKTMRLLGKRSNNHVIRISNGEETVNDYMLYMVENEGFPIWRDPQSKGNLIIQMLIDPPLSKEIPASHAKHVDEIKKCFNVEEFEDMHPDVEEVTAIPFDEKLHTSPWPRVWDQDDDSQRAGVRCQNQ